MPRTALPLLLALGLITQPLAQTPSKVEFIGMAAPSTPAERASVYSAASVKLTFADGTTATQPLSYHTLFATGDTLGGQRVGGLYDAQGAPLLDESAAGEPTQFVAQTPDANSLLQVAGADAAALGVSGNPLFLVTHYEYVSRDRAGQSRYGQLPMAMSLATIEQNRDSGELRAVDYANIDMAEVNGLWSPCAGSLSPWNTHLGSEEYEPDARRFEQDDTAAPFAAMTQHYFKGSERIANPYDYGLLPEVRVAADATTEVVKHRTLGRASREMVKVMPDQRTLYMGDDGAYTGLFMFIADRPADLSEGTLYAARWQQVSADNGGVADLQWIRLGHASDEQVARLAASHSFSDIFELDELADGEPGYTQVLTNKGLEWLKLNPGMQQAAAFLETRRYAAYLGATTEFTKMEGVALNAADARLYIAMSYIHKGMESIAGEPADHIRLPRQPTGAVYQLALAGEQRDSEGRAIDSNFVATRMQALVQGKMLKRPDAAGNLADEEQLANPDNLAFSEQARTLFIGEDSSLHVNNFVWAYHVDTGALARVLSVPAGSEATGLQMVENLNGFAYLMSNFQHPGDTIRSMNPALRRQVAPLIQRHWNSGKRASVGYLSGLPVINTAQP